MYEGEGESLGTLYRHTFTKFLSGASSAQCQVALMTAMKNCPARDHNSAPLSSCGTNLDFLTKCFCVYVALHHLLASLYI